MDFSFTEEQRLLRDSLAAWLADHYDFDKRRAAVAKPEGRDPGVWKAFADELGILGATFSEEDGGLGGGPIEAMIIQEELGRRLVTEPYLATAVIGGGLLKQARTPTARDLIGEIIGGEAILAFAWAEPRGRDNLAALASTARRNGTGFVINGHKAVVSGAPWASHLVATARTGGGERDRQGVSLFLVEKSTPGITTRDYPTVDGGRAADVFFENVSVPAEALIGQEGEALPLVERVVDEAIAATCAEACGVLRELHQGTVDYTRQRKQFGAPIASFQVLQHRMVDMYMHLEQAVSMTYMAHLKLGEGDAERARAASAAKVQVGRACRFVGQNAIQLHGGMGMTEELAIGHYFKRATLIEAAFGSTDHHLARYEALSFANAP